MGDTWRVGDVEIERGVPASMRDGCRLIADVYRPTSFDRPLPALVMRTPYDRRVGTETNLAHPMWYARQGFIVVVQDTRGRFESEGTFFPFIHEGEDGYDTVEWAARLPGCNGKVGLYGDSYIGYSQLLTAANCPPSLGSISPATAGADLARNWMYEGDAMSLAFTAWWAAALGIDVARRANNDELENKLGAALADPLIWYSSSSPRDLVPIAQCLPFYAEWLQHPPDDPYWQQWSVARMYGSIKVPALHIGGWYDIFNDGTVRNFMELSRLHAESTGLRQELLEGPWWHVPYGRTIGSVDFGPDATGFIVDRAIVDFHRRHLDPEATEGPEQPRVRYFVLFENAWRSAESWPPANSHPEVWYLHSGGSANTSGGDGRLSLDPTGNEPVDLYVYDPASPVGSNGGHSCCFEGQAPMGAYDQSRLEQRMDILVYTSAPLDHDLTLAGPVELSLWVATDAPDADYTGKLCVVNGDTSINIAECICRATDKLKSAKKGDPIHLEFTLRHVAARVQTGQRLRLEVTGGSFPMYDINPQSGVPAESATARDYAPATHAMFHTQDMPSHLTITVIDGTSGDA